MARKPIANPPRRTRRARGISQPSPAPVTAPVPAPQPQPADLDDDAIERSLSDQAARDFRWLLEGCDGEQEADAIRRYYTVTSEHRRTAKPDTLRTVEDILEKLKTFRRKMHYNATRDHKITRLFASPRQRGLFCGLINEIKGLPRHRRKTPPAPVPEATVEVTVTTATPASTKFQRGGSFEDDSEPQAAPETPKKAHPVCPDCKGKTELRDGRRGPFYGCVKFPRCRGIVDAAEWEVHQEQAAEVELPVKFQAFKETAYQGDIKSAIETGTEHLVIEAVAGSGKTTTLEWVLWVAGLVNVIFLAFNKRIAAELAERIRCIALARSLSARTLNSLGAQAVRAAFGRCELNDRKYRDIARKMLKPAAKKTDKDARKRERLIFNRAATALSKLARMARSNLSAPLTEDAIIADLVARYSIDVPSERQAEVYKLLPEILNAGIDMARSEKVIDFADQIWLPVVLGLPVRSAPTVMVDEVQDLDRCKTELAHKAAGAGGRIIAVGDRYQSIYAWAGADSRSIPRLIERLGQTARGVRTLPLSECFRCPQVVVDLVNRLDLVPRFEATAGAIKGVLRAVSPKSDWLDKFTKQTRSTAILSRRNAPTFPICMELLRRGILAAIAGKDVLAQTRNLVETLDGGGMNDRLPLFLAALRTYEESERERLGAIEDEDGLEKLHDLCETLRALSRDLKTISALTQRLDELTVDSSTPEGREKLSKCNVVLSSCHQSKGLEWDSVYIIEPNLLPGPWAQEPEDVRQEINLQYVAYTRAKKELVFVGPAPCDLSWADPDYEPIEIDEEPEDEDAGGRNDEPEPETVNVSDIELPSFPSVGDGSFTGCTREDWIEVRDAYRKAGVSAELVKPDRWHQLALWVGDVVRVSTTVNDGASKSRRKGANAIDIVRVADLNGRPLDGRKKVLRRAGWKGRTCERINAILRNAGTLAAY